MSFFDLVIVCTITPMINSTLFTIAIKTPKDKRHGGIPGKYYAGYIDSYGLSFGCLQTD